MLRKVLAVILGCATIALLSLLLDPVAGAVVKFFAAGKGPLVIVCAGNVLALFLASLGGGFVATRVAHHRGPANVLAVLSLLAGVAYAVNQKSAAGPPWYPMGLPLAGALGAFLGGWIRGEV